ncbi:helix-turn-helix transcriptional regulator [Haloplanus sp. C73]|uniref:helix-turn-helix transcriptional regulator n=1 Tax=Haloplanus sp. C73 TaxID=3421641 RepID=UPI003EB84574
MGEDALAFLASSAVRPEMLTAFRDHGRLSLRDLDARLSISRRTLKRTLSEMMSRGWVRRRGGTYEFTALGDAVLTAYEGFRERERVARRCRAFLEHTPAHAFDASLDALADANVVGTDADPTAPVDRLVDIRAGATELREYAPFLIIDTVRQLAARVDADAPPDVTLILGTATPDGVSDEYRERFATLAAAPTVDVHIYPDGPPFAFGVADGHAFVGAATMEGMPRALLEGDAPPLVAWVDQQFDRYLGHADPL